jgi:hypothetical protein
VRALSAYAQQHGEPHLASSRVQADLAWAMTGTGDYALSEPSATKDGKRKKGKAAKKQ